MDVDQPLDVAQPSETLNQPVSRRSEPRSSSTDEVRDDETTARAAAAVRRRRGPRALMLDPVQELANSDLQAWQTDYASNMREAARKKTTGRMLNLAKSNAEYWMWGSGIGGVGALAKEHRLSSSLGFLHGESLLASMTGPTSEIDHTRDRNTAGNEQQTDSERHDPAQRDADSGLNEDAIMMDDDLALPMNDEVCTSTATPTCPVDVSLTPTA